MIRMRHRKLPNKTDRFSKFKRTLDNVLLQINTFSKSDKTKALTYVYQHLQEQQFSRNLNKSRRKTKLIARTDHAHSVKRCKVKLKLECPVCNQIKDTKSAILKHLEHFHIGVPLSCLRCRKTFNSEPSYNWHILNLCWRKKRISLKKFKCPECPKEYAVKRHLILHQSGHKRNNCPHCNTTLTKRNELIDHLLIRHNVQLKRAHFNCDYCQKSFIKRRSLYSHLRSHLKAEVVCLECGKISTCKAEHNGHEQEHAKQKPWQCSICKERFARRNVYFAHLIKHERYKCLTCKESFASKLRVYQHRVKGHIVQGLTPHSCPYCPLQFYRIKLLESHLNVHIEHSSEAQVLAEAEAYTCEYCGQQYTKKFLLDQHLLRLHCTARGLYSCEHCDYASRFRSNIARHLRLHLTKEKQFVCDHCGKFFSNGAVLTDHIKYVHKQVKQFKCPMCEKCFKRKPELTRHQSVHSSVKPYNCELCSNSYKRISHLRRHERNVHNIATKTNRVQHLIVEDEAKGTASSLNKTSTTGCHSVAPDFHFQVTELVLQNELPEIIGFVDGLSPTSL
ncbi:hypothetical protein PPYR_01782 [Photinus pyralis]|uniref:C2H2-type domain-containing protein n=2 Tax=Photinus pyralis TaxID=7054 RepID=A0A1Y1MJJ5_PHOPY|nr:zinc finger protein 420-like [Photinus pyralis]KAB0804812.1 hypothetical protein PPYR_01782 [Photinus pyralis]